MTLLFSPALSVVALRATTAADVIQALAARLHAEGHVKATFERAALARERRSPTGLPFDPWPVGLPHAEPDHVLRPGIAIATLASPVVFRQMGSPQVSLAVSIVVMPALTAKEQAAAALARLIGLLQAEPAREELARATTADALMELLAARWDVP